MKVWTFHVHALRGMSNLLYRRRANEHRDLMTFQIQTQMGGEETHVGWKVTKGSKLIGQAEKERQLQRRATKSSARRDESAKKQNPRTNRSSEKTKRSAWTTRWQPPSACLPKRPTCRMKWRIKERGAWDPRTRVRELPFTSHCIIIYDLLRDSTNLTLSLEHTFLHQWVENCF